MHGNEEKRLLRVKTEKKKEEEDPEFEMELSAGGKLVSGDKEDRNIEGLTGWVEKPTCKEISSLRIGYYLDCFVSAQTSWVLHLHEVPQLRKR